MDKNICPVCGYDGLYDPPYNERGIESFEICPCCGFQFGNDDYPDGPLAFKKWRQKWIDGGCVWFSRGSRCPPDNWNAEEQLKTVIGKQGDGSSL